MGVLRLLLALTVLNWHYQITPFNFLFSYAAVYIFFIISGFYIAMVITEKYGTDARGTLAFYENRLLRLLPVYYIALFGSHFAGQYSLFNGGAWLLINQLLIFPQALWATITLEPYGSGYLLLAQMYTVALEMMFYAIAPLIVLRSIPVIGSVLLSSVVLNIIFWIEFEGIAVPQRAWQYDFFPSTLMYFLGGVLAYRLYVAVAKKCSYPAWIGYCALPLIVFCGWLTGSGPQHRYTDNYNMLFFYLLCAVAIPFLFVASKHSRIDRFIGDLSYPLYVAHVPAIWIVWATPWLGGRDKGAVAVLVIALVFSLALTIFVDLPVERLRHRLFSRRRGPLLKTQSAGLQST